MAKGDVAPGDLRSVRLGYFRDSKDEWLRVAYVSSNILAGLLIPIFLYLFSQFANALVPGMSSTHPWRYWCGLMVVTAFADFVFVALGTGCAEVTAERQLRVLRVCFLHQIMRQEISYFDRFDAISLAAQLSLNCKIFRDARGLRSGLIFMYAGLSGGCLIFAFLQSPQMAAVCTCTLPLIVAAGYYASKIDVSANGKTRRAWEEAAAHAREALGAMRTVKAFALEPVMQQRYQEAIQRAHSAAIAGINNIALAMGAYWGLIFGTSAFGFWYGAKMIADGLERGDIGCGSGINGGKGAGMSGNQANVGLCFDAGKASGVFIDVVCAAYFAGKLLPMLSLRVRARRALSEITNICSRQTDHDPYSEEGHRPTHIEGNLTFRDVNFSYPTRSEFLVFENLNLKIPAGQSTALVGASGMGKSTIVHLLEKFYAPDSGSIEIDGDDLQKCNTAWLRSQISLVSQEPKLFASTIADNIRAGKEDASMEEVIWAAREANAHSFISRLSSGYETWVGEDGGQLSGGQKQRVAIARALIRKAPILILDEATSALDNHSERIVQDTLDRLLTERARTTIIIAHRLSTVRKADKIVVLNKAPGCGACVAEEGNHESLAAKPGGLYAALVATQTEGPDQFFSSQESISIAQQFSREFSLRDQSILALKAEFMDNDASFTDDRGTDSATISYEPVPGLQLFTRACEPTKQHKAIFAVGCVGAILNGAVWPVFAIAFSWFMDAYGQLNSDRTMRTARHWACVMGGIGVIALVGHWWQASCLGRCGEHNALSVNSKLYASLLRQEVRFFDEPKNSSGALVHLLTHDVSVLRGWTGESVGIIMSAICCLVIGAITAMHASWKIGLTALASIVVMFPMSYISSLLTTTGGSLSRTKKAEDLTHIMVEVIMHIRTIYAYNLQGRINARFGAMVEGEYRQGITRAGKAALLNGGVNCLRMLVFTGIFYYGGELTRRGEVEPRDLIQGSLCLLLAAMQLGRTFMSSTSAREGKLSAERIFALIDRELSVNELGDDLERIDDVGFHHVSFRYPSRQENPVFDDVSFMIPRGSVVALVGASGCGKSTVVQLIERFYDVTVGGAVSVNARDIKSYSVRSLRSRIGLVSQEPCLFRGSLEENVLFGNASATPEQVESACRMANAWNFIQHLPRKMQTNVGRGGSALSGGQKQRVSIARALVRNPDLLILDEATSALDNESELLVQEALSKLLAQKSFTTLIVAHRLTTVRKADYIVVFHGDHGSRIAEIGNHEELMQIPNGIYRGLVRIANTS